uniref:Uncharacterized protein n=1 Tax=Oryza rufipogon TaxID=4529 RepID=A0A0E0NNE4_ORYRU
MRLTRRHRPSGLGLVGRLPLHPIDQPADGFSRLLLQATRGHGQSSSSSSPPGQGQIEASHHGGEARYTLLLQPQHRWSVVDDDRLHHWRHRFRWPQIGPKASLRRSQGLRLNAVRQQGHISFSGYVELMKSNICACVRAYACIHTAASTFPGITIAEQGDWDKCIQGSTAVVNLAGMPISTRWSPEVVNYINNASGDARPSVFVSATAIGFYGTSEISSFDESSPSGNDYLAEVCREWEARACQVNQEDVRLVLLRIGVVLGKDGGALAKMIPLFMMFAGGPLGTGRQWFSWIHQDDLVDLIYESLKNPSYKGVINGTAPNPVRLSEMCERLGRVVGRPSWLPVPEIALKAVLGEGASVLEGQKVLPVKAKQLGFSYRYPYVQDALRAIARDL